MRQRRSRPMFFLDLAMPPRHRAGGVRDVYNVFAYGLDDLEEVARENRLRRSREVPRAEAIVDEELNRFLGWFGNLAVVPTVTDLRRKLETLRDAELANAPARSDAGAARRFADSLLGELLHEPMRRLKGEPDPARKLDRVEAVRHLFDLDE